MTLVGSWPFVVELKELLVLLLQLRPSERVVACQIATLRRLQIWYTVSSISLFRIAEGMILESEPIPYEHFRLTCCGSCPYLTDGRSNRSPLDSGMGRGDHQNNPFDEYRSGYQTSENFK